MLTGAVVHKLTTTDDTPESSTSIYGDYLSGATIEKVSSSDAEYGVDLYNSSDSVISHNKLTATYYGLTDDEAGEGNSWSDNTLSNVIYTGVTTSDATNDMIADNKFTGSTGSAAIDNSDDDDVTVTGNTLDDVYDGVFDANNDGDTISDNHGSHDSWGIYTEADQSEVLTGNTFTDGEYGIEADYPLGETLSKNVTNDNREGGIYVWTDDESGSGLAAKLTKNTGNDNRFGLYSQIPTTGSGNKATGNKVVNCYNVTCSGASSGGTVAPVHRQPTLPRLIPARNEESSTKR